MKFIALKTEDGAVKGKLSLYCRTLEVSWQGFCKYLVNQGRPWKYQTLADEMLSILAEDACNDTYGRKRMYQALMLSAERLAPSGAMGRPRPQQGAEHPEAPRNHAPQTQERGAEERATQGASGGGGPAPTAPQGADTADGAQGGPEGHTGPRRRRRGGRKPDRGAEGTVVYLDPCPVWQDAHNHTAVEPPWFRL